MKYSIMFKNSNKELILGNVEQVLKTDEDVTFIGDRYKVLAYFRLDEVAGFYEYNDFNINDLTIADYENFDKM